MSSSKQHNLNNREAIILKDTVESFIEYSTPISSGFLKKKCGYSFSPATIRSAFSNLEQKGYLMHPHTSSGRIPTDFGYRYYVDALRPIEVFSEYSPEILQNELLNIASNVDDLLDATANMLSRISHLFGVVMISRYQHSILSDIELVPIHSNRIMLILAMESGFVRSIVLNLDVNVNSRHLELITKILKERLAGCSLEDIQATITERLKDTEIFSHEVVQILVNHSSEHFNIEKDKLIYTSSPNALLRQPEFQDINLFQRLLPALEKAYLTQVFNEKFLGKPSCTLIGDETQDKLLNNCAILTKSFIGDTVRGRLGILGPTRLPYKSIQALLNNFAEIIPSVL